MGISQEVTPGHPSEGWKHDNVPQLYTKAIRMSIFTGTVNRLDSHRARSNPQWIAVVKITKKNNTRQVDYGMR